jgi:hypothetical protein
MDFELRFTDKEITAWAGMGLLKRMLDHMRFDTALSIAGCPSPALPLCMRFSVGNHRRADCLLAHPRKSPGQTAILLGSKRSYSTLTTE